MMPDPFCMIEMVFFFYEALERENSERGSSQWIS